MSEDNPSILSHVSLGTNNLAKAADFYDKTLVPGVLGCHTAQ